MSAIARRIREALADGTPVCPQMILEIAQEAIGADTLNSIDENSEIAIIQEALDYLNDLREETGPAMLFWEELTKIREALNPLPNGQHDYVRAHRMPSYCWRCSHESGDAEKQCTPKVGLSNGRILTLLSLWLKSANTLKAALIANRLESIRQRITH